MNGNDGLERFHWTCPRAELARQPHDRGSQPQAQQEAEADKDTSEYRWHHTYALVPA